MSDRQLQTEIAGLLETARPEWTPELEARAVAAVGEARARPARSRRRMIAVAVGAAAALVGLGFVPIPMGRSKGVLDRALASASNARTVHISGRNLRHGFESEEWLSEDGFHRREYRAEGRNPTQVMLEADGWDASYSVNADGRTSDGKAYYDPCTLQPAPMPDRLEFFGQLHRRRVAEKRHEYARTSQPREYREASLWGGEVDVVEVRTTYNEDATEGCTAGSIGDVPWTRGDVLLSRSEFDPQTGALLSKQEYRLHNGGSELVSEETYEWNVEIPEELKQIKLSPGRKLTRSFGWQSRAQEIIARDSTKDWVFTLHAIEVSRRGEVELWVSRTPTPEQNPDIYNSGPSMKVEAVGSAGERYTQDHRFSCMNSRYVGYWTTTLRPERESSQPARVTLKIWPYDCEPCEDQWTIFRDLPLPARGDFDTFDELRARDEDVVQY